MSKAITLGQKIAEARRAKKVTQQELADYLGVSAQAVSGWERDQSFPEIGKLVKVAYRLGTTLDHFFDDPDRPSAMERVTQLREERPTFIPGNQLVGDRDFPIYAAAMGGNGHMIVHTDVMEYVKRPVILEGVPDSYGVLIVGESMIPAYRSGDMALVHPRRPPERDTDVILYDQDHRTGDAQSMIKHLVGFNDRAWKLEQYNPAKTFSEHRADWPICHQVVGKYNGR